MDGPANGLVMYCHQIEIGDLLVLSTFKNKLCIKMTGFPREIFTTSIFYLIIKKTMKMTWLHMLAGLFFCSSQWPSQIGPTAENDHATVPSPIFFLPDTYPWFLH
jgi:hypothetical protein